MRKKWCLFHATDFQTLMNPCFIVCRITGMFPYKINASTFEISQPCYVLSTVVVCFYCAFYLLYIYDIINTETFSEFEYVTEIIDDVCFFTFNGLIPIVTYILSNPRMRLLQTISEVYLKLPSESHQMLSRLIHTKDILGIILTLVIVLLFLLSEEDSEINSWDSLVTLFLIYLYILGFHMNMLYMNCICVLKASFKKINDDLMHMQSDILNDRKPSFPSLICHMQRNQLFLMEVKTLMKQHLMISETVQKLNLTFSLQLLATVILSITEIIFGLYEYVKWQGGAYLDFDGDLETLLMHMMYFILQIILIVWACETVKNQAQEIGITVCNVLNTTRDDQIKYELQLFSLQILHHRNIFSVKGLTVDATLLTAMVDVITTYMLILIQFLIMSHSCDETSVINT